MEDAKNSPYSLFLTAYCHKRAHYRMIEKKGNLLLYEDGNWRFIPIIPEKMDFIPFEVMPKNSTEFIIEKVYWKTREREETAFFFLRNINISNLSSDHNLNSGMYRHNPSAGIFLSFFKIK